MDIGDEVMENSIPSLIKDSLDSIQKGKVGSPEDIAWVDSCLIKESDISDDNWDSLKAAVVEILNFQPESLSSSSLESIWASWASDIEPSTEDIFRVWNLEVPVEEDDFVKQLNNALEDGLPQSLPSSFPDSDVWKNLEETSVDDLVAGIADLSLNQICS
ncbi:hypothetical protein M0R45_008405 [Rubus argutus]|uniref:Uncharacterized protein n=1 Tax=Rubus argutus TaxID=59490 RepID=A0AAW1Y224_RUBAR